MSKKNATNNLQRVLPLDAFTRALDTTLHGPDAKYRTEPSIFHPIDRQHDGNGRPLARSERSSISRLLDADRQDYFLDDDPEQQPDAPDASAGHPAPSAADAAETDDSDDRDRDRRRKSIAARRRRLFRRKRSNKFQRVHRSTGS
jgi:hypothetical protein